MIGLLQCAWNCNDNFQPRFLIPKRAMSANACILLQASSASAFEQCVFYFIVRIFEMTVSVAVFKLQSGQTKGQYFTWLESESSICTKNIESRAF